MVTNMGAASDVALIGVTVTIADPDWPCLRLRDPGAIAIEKSGVVPAVAARVETAEFEVLCVESPE
jgi:hypothetical protein